ncbi:MAG: hypothetical protein U1D55_05455 [Phycisphaerae bacterium]
MRAPRLAGLSALTLGLLAGCPSQSPTEVAGETAVSGGVVNSLDTWTGAPGGSQSTGTSGQNNGAAGGQSSSSASNDPTFTLEPDDFAPGTDVSKALSQVTLSTTGSDNVPVPLFTVTATDDNLDIAPTGSNVFGHADIGFFNNDRRLRMDFTAPVKGVSILFAGGTFFETEIARLQVYDAGNSLLAEYVTQPRGAGAVEEMSIQRSSADIAWALAYEAEGDGSFARLDKLVITP